VAPESVSSGAPVCGTVSATDTDRFRINVNAGDCFTLDFQAQSASLHLVGAGLDITQGGSSTAQFQAAESGAFDIVVSGSSADGYVFILR
jgi:hypothetical protein